MLFLKERRDPVSHKLFRETTLRTEDLKDTVPFSLRLPAGYYGVLYDEKGTHILRGRFIRIHKEEARA
jgi:hypothetical protein